MDNLEPQVLPTQAELKPTCFKCDIVDHIHTCKKCGNLHCHTHTSKISPLFCEDCFKEVTLTVEKYTKTEEDYDDVLDRVITRRNTCKVVRLDGPDYVWHLRWLQKATDEELAIIYEFFFFMMKFIENENDTRKVAKRAERVRTQVPLRTTTVKETKEKKVTKPKDLKAELLKQGLPEHVVNAMLAAMNTASK